MVCKTNRIARKLERSRDDVAAQAIAEWQLAEIERGLAEVLTSEFASAFEVTACSKIPNFKTHNLIRGS